jgi:molybdopterin-guanine dinucleotide biosynthesis protein A
VTDDENLSVKGPLLGLLSVHQRLPAEDLLVIACDMLNLKKIVLQNLLAEYRKANFDAYVFTTSERVQPLCAVYTSKGLNKIYNIYLANQLKKFSMMYVLECLDTKFISAEAFAECFINYNSIEDITAMNQSTE